MRFYARVLPRALYAAGVLTLVLAGLEVRSASLPSYAIQDLGTLGGAASQGFALSGAQGGLVTGTADTTYEGDQGPNHAFLWNAAQPAAGPQDIGTLKLMIWDELYAMSFDDSISTAFGINDDGHVVGESTTADYSKHAFFWSDLNGDGDGRVQLADGTDGPLDPGLVDGEYEMLDLGTLGDSSVARALNNRDEIVGYSAASAGDSQAVLWRVVRTAGQPSQVTMATLPVVDSSVPRSSAHGINGANPPAIVGAGCRVIGSSVQERATMWRLNGATSQYDITDLGVLSGHTRSIAYSVNDLGAVVGVSSLSNGSSARAFRWTPGGGMVNLGTLPRGTASVAYDVNGSGAVVGYGTTSTGARRAILYTDGTGMIDLNSRLSRTAQKEWVLQAAHSISDNGIITGWGVRSGKKRAFRLLPQ